MFLLAFRLNDVIHVMYPYTYIYNTYSPRTSIIKTAKSHFLTCLTSSEVCLNIYESLKVAGEKKSTMLI